MKRIFFILLCCWAVYCYSQDIYTPILEEIERNSTTLRALRQNADAAVLEARTGLTLSDPEVEVGYLWGRPNGVGNRRDVAVSQAFDFPTAYVYRSRLSKAERSTAEQGYLASRQSLLLEAKRALIELIYYNALTELYTTQRDNAMRIASAVKRRIEEGDATIIESNKAAMAATAAEDEFCRAEAERATILSTLNRLNGGTEVVFSINTFPVIAEDAVTIPPEESVESAPEVACMYSSLEEAKAQIGLSKALSLPRLTVGYMGEFVTGERFQGVTFGLSLPLWEHRSEVRRDRAAALAAQAAAEDAAATYSNRLATLATTAQSLQRSIARYDSLFTSTSITSGLATLGRAYDEGEISLLDYLLEQDYYITFTERRLQALRDLHLTLAELHASEL